MEQLDAAVFDVLLKFLSPKDAGRLGAVSRTQRRLVDGSLWWKEWCEQDSPSLKTFPASETVEFHYNKDGGRGYKRLLSKVVGGFCLESKPCHCSKSTGKVALPGFEAYVMLMDVYVRGEAVLSCSADGADLDKDSGDRCWPGNVRKLAKTVVRAEQTDERLFSVTQEMKLFLNPVDQDDVLLGRAMPPNPPYYQAQDVLHYSWKVMRKSDGRLLRLVDKEPATYTDARAGSGSMLVNLGAAQGDLNVARGFYVLRAVAPLLDADDLEWPWLEPEPYRAVMRLRCHVVESFNVGNHTFPDTSDGFSIEVGLAKEVMADNCFYHDMVYLSNELCRMFLKNSYWR